MSNIHLFPFVNLLSTAPCVFGKLFNLCCLTMEEVLLFFYGIFGLRGMRECLEGLRVLGNSCRLVSSLTPF